MNNPTYMVVNDEAVLTELRGRGHQAFMIGAEYTPDLRDAEVIVCGNHTDAKEAMLALQKRGIPDFRLSYIDSGTADGAIKHFYWDDAVTLDDIPADADFETYATGIGFLDKNLGWGWRLPELCVMAGPYGCGKSTIAQILAACFVNGAGRKIGSGALICSWEDLDAEVKRNFGLFGKAHNAPDMGKLVSFVRRPPDLDRLMSWYMDLVTYYVRRYNVRFFVLDPWNEMDHQKTSAAQSETDYVRDMMKEFRRLVDKLGIILIIATHVPAKLIRGDGSLEPFKIAQAFGSVQFGNKADRGICVIRTKRLPSQEDDAEPIVNEKGYAIIRLDKAKIERKMGKKGTVACRLNADKFLLEYDSYATSCVEELWRD